MVAQNHTTSQHETHFWLVLQVLKDTEQVLNSWRRSCSRSPCLGCNAQGGERSAAYNPRLCCTPTAPEIELLCGQFKADVRNCACAEKTSMHIWSRTDVLIHWHKRSLSKNRRTHQLFWTAWCAYRSRWMLASIQHWSAHQKLASSSSIHLLIDRTKENKTD